MKLDKKKSVVFLIISFCSFSSMKSNIISSITSGRTFLDRKSWTNCVVTCLIIVSYRLLSDSPIHKLYVKKIAMNRMKICRVGRNFGFLVDVPTVDFFFMILSFWSLFFFAVFMNSRRFANIFIFSFFITATSFFIR